MKNIDSIIESIDQSLGNTVNDMENFLNIDKNEAFKKIKGISDSLESIIKGTFSTVEGGLNELN